MIDTSFWFMFPVGIAIATIAMLAGIGGAVLFSPFFMLVLKLDPLIALGAGLAIEFFGFSSGVIGYWYKKVINFSIVKQLIMFTIPATIVGVILGRVFPVFILKLMLALLLLYLAYQFLLKGKECLPKDPRCTGISTSHEKVAINKLMKGTSFVGGLLIGMISAGLGEINELNFLKKLKLAVPSASGTSVFLVAMSATVGVLSHAYFLFSEGETSVFTNVISILVFTVPGVIIGAQFGVLLSNTINRDLMGRFVGILFLILAVLTFLIVFQS
ncbi:sulfite exporter TauE/SafE family protein [Chloroflexota bacterium]